MKKVISLLLSFIMIFSFALPVFAAGEEEKIVTVYLAGRGNCAIIDKDGNVLKDQKEIDRGAYIKEHAGPIIDKLALAVATNDYEDYIQSLVDAFAPIYADKILDENGNPQNGTHIVWDYKTAPVELGNRHGIPAYEFFYDWRISPMEVADQLHSYIQRVLAATCADKVNLYARCYGVNVAMAYVAKSYQGEYGEDAFVVNHMVHDTPGLAGYLLVAGLLSGSIVFDADKIDRYCTYFLNGSEIFDDPEIESLAAAFVSILNSAKILGFGTDVIEDIYEKVAPEVISRIALCATYGRTLAYWAMMGDYYKKAINTVFYTDELKTQYSGLIEKADAYYELLLKDRKYEDLLLELDEKGVKTAVFSKYGQITFPLFEDSEITGDVRGTVVEGSYGATAVEYGNTLSESYILQAKVKGTDKYISADKEIDASTCLFPDRTWFLKNVEHDNFPVRMAQLAQEFFESDGTLTVFDSSLSQFMDYKNNFAEVKESEKFSWTNNPLVNLFKLLTSLLKMLVSYIKGL